MKLNAQQQMALMSDLKIIRDSLAEAVEAEKLGLRLAAAQFATRALQVIGRVDKLEGVPPHVVNVNAALTGVLQHIAAGKGLPEPPRIQVAGQVAR